MDFKRIAKQVLPPILVDAGRWIRTASNGYREWEYLPDGWATQNDRIKGWNVQGVLEAYKAKWPAFVSNLEGTLPFGISPEAGLSARTDLAFHNAIMSYAYALTLSSRNKASLSLLDWGGGIGHYYLISQALVPDLEIEYHCKDVPILVEYGRTLFPQAHFYMDETCLGRQYDFVVASGSLQFSRDWSSTLEGLAASTAGYMFVTSLPIVLHSPSFVFVQRPYQYGYDTEYLGWCLNREQFLQSAGGTGLELVREFIIGHQPFIYRAPEQNEYRGYLFRSPNAHQH